MKIKDILEQPLDIALPLLRSYGVRALSVDGISITLGHLPAEQKTYVEPSRFEDDSKDDKMSCGHSIWEANETGECLHGCLSDTKNEDTN
jgi:hypothetical protein